MGIQNRIDTLSDLTQTLLAAGESEQVDFKRKPEGLSTEDFVAFANMPNGGTILAGIDEKTVENAQIGVVRGCDVSDGAILQVLNKALSCTPPVSINIFTENLVAEPILRIEIPPSATRPHCTTKGVYCRRDGARNRPLHPSELLKIFLETEASVFTERFDVAAKRIIKELGSLETSLNESIENMSARLGWADSQLGDTENSLNSILSYTRRQELETQDIASRLRTLFRQDKRTDPVRDREHAKLVDDMISQLRSRPDLVKSFVAGNTLSVNTKGKAALELTSEDVKQAVADAVKELRAEDAYSNYAIFCKAPNDCETSELDAFDGIVAEGGEVTAGVRKRVNSAYILGFISCDNEIVGTAALKVPAKTYRAKVFKNAKSAARSSNYELELGWIFLKPEHRKKGQMTRLLRLLMTYVSEERLFSTTRTDNEVMIDVLPQWGFVQEGEPYASERDADRLLQLFICDAVLEGPNT